MNDALLPLRQRLQAVLAQPVLAPSAKRYRQDFKRFLTFMVSAGILTIRLPPRGTPLTDTEIAPFLPVPEDVLLTFIASLAPKNNQQSILQVLSGLQYFHDLAGIPWAARHAHRVGLFLKGHRRELPTSAPGFAPAVHATDLLLLRQRIRVDETWAGQPVPVLRLLWCLAVWAFKGLFRLGELVVGDPATVDARRLLRREHVRTVTFGGRVNLVVTLPFPKHADPSVGTEVPLKPPSQSTDLLDPVQAWFDYLACRPDSIPYAFVDPGTGALPTRVWFNTLLRRYIPTFTGASFRAGGATDLAYRGFDFAFIQRLGRWKEDTFQRYIRNHPLILLAQLYFVEDTGSHPHFGFV